MSADQTSQPKQEAGQPPDHSSTNPIVRAVERAVDKLEVSRGYIEREIDVGRQDIRDIRDRLARLETKVGDLPSKVWIGGFVGGGVAVLVGVLTLVFKLITGK